MSSLQDILSTIPIFSFLGRNEIAAVESLFIESTHQKGEYLCREGEEGETFHIVLDGELEVVVGQDESARVLSILKKGDFFGEMVLLQGGKRTASVIVSRRARIVTLDRSSFNSLFLKNPKALEYFTRVLCKRVANANKGDVVHKSSLTISVGAAADRLKGKTLLSEALAAVLNDITGAEVLLVRLSSASPEAAVDLQAAASGDGLDRAVEPAAEGVFRLEVPVRPGQDPNYYAECGSNVIARFNERFSFIIFDIGAEPRGLMDAIDLFSDVYVEIGDLPEPLVKPGASQKKMKCFRVVNRFNITSRALPISSCEPYVMPHDGWLNQESSTDFLRKNPRSVVGLPVHRLARKILGATVGVALGGGAAFGIAHLGVLQVLEKNGIPIDLIAGCSQGSIIGVGYAAGVSTNRMVEIALRLGHWKNSLLAVDLTITRPGLLLGDSFVRIFEPFLSNVRTFADLLMPCMTVATDIESGERVPIGSGLLTTAFRASAAVPMVFAPVKMGDRVLVDGGVSDPVPAEVVNSMGADLCVAVNVVPPLKLGVENAVSKAVRMVNRFNPLSYLNGGTGMPPMFDIIMNSMQVLQHELGNFKAISADVLIKPDLSDFTWIEYYRSNELIERGAEAAERAMPAIHRVLDQKLGPYKKKRSTSKATVA
ncbi:MAG TPA: patatin-like phospholipase family protein [Bryobacteraceae bacterium]|jgi:NTE family protein|nr:patatin-like phospholipase family protein [Bryobacteraceae bacterium]